MTFNDLLGLIIENDGRPSSIRSNFSNYTFHHIVGCLCLDGFDDDVNKSTEASHCWKLHQKVSLHYFNFQIKIIRILAPKLNSIFIWDISGNFSRLCSICEFSIKTQCLKIIQNVAFEFLNFGIFHQFLYYKKLPVW